MLLEKHIQEMQMLLNHLEAQKSSVSEKGIDWHVDHSLKVIISICKTLKKSDPAQYQWKFNWKRTYIFMRGSIPRGIGRAPKIVVAQDKIDPASIVHQLEEAKAYLAEIEMLPKNSHFKHPYFGLLPLKKSKRFLELHTEHHLKICRDILGSK